MSKTTSAATRAGKIGILGLLLFAAFFSSGCIDVNVSTPIPAPMPTPIPTIAPTPIPTTIPIPTPAYPDYLEGYYSFGNMQPKDVSLIEWLTEYEWAEGFEYERGKFDCSQMAALTECVLENAGYETVIQVGNNHAWLLINLPAGIVIEENIYKVYTTPTDGWYAFESTSRYFVTGESDKNYVATKQYDSIFDVWDDYEQYGEDFFLEEWGWWK